MKIYDFVTKVFIKKQLAILEVLTYIFWNLSIRFPEFRPFVGSILNGYNGLKGVYLENYPNVKIKPKNPDRMKYMNGSFRDMPIVPPHEEDFVDRFRTDYITKNRDYPIELTGDEIYEVCCKYLLLPGMFALINRLIQIITNPDERIIRNRYYMLVEDTPGNIYPVLLPNLCKRSTHDDIIMMEFYDQKPQFSENVHEVLEYSGIGEGDGIKDMIRFHICSMNKRINMAESFNHFKNEVSEHERRMYQAYINAYNKYFVESPIFKESGIYKFELYRVIYDDNLSDEYFEIRIS